MKNFKRRTFTLVELLVVVTILAILAGGAIAVFDGVERRAAKGQAISEIAALSAVIKNATTISEEYPTNFDSLLMTRLNEDPPNNNNVSEYVADGILTLNDDRIGLYSNVANWPEMRNKNLVDFKGSGGNKHGGVGMVSASIIPFLSEELQAKISLTQFPVEAQVLDSLCRVGVISLRYIDYSSIHNSSTRVSGINIAPAFTAGAPRYARWLDLIDGSQAFEEPESEEEPRENQSDAKNLGRGGTVYIAKGATDTTDGLEHDIDLVTWNPGVNGVNNLRIGANANDVLVAFGIGVNSLGITDVVDTDVNFTDTVVGLATVPKYGATPQAYIYGRYIALFKVGEIVDVNGASDLTQFVVADTLVKHKGESARRTDTTGTFYALHERGVTPGYKPVESALFVAVVDCFGNSKVELQTQFNN